jgi:ribonucleoside-diphosphate reductase beta chain
MWNGFWTPNLFNFKADYNQFKTDITDEERQIIVRTLSAIGQVEIAVKTFWAKLGENLPHPSISDLGFVLANTEVVHNNAYEKLLEVLGLEDAFQDNLKEPVVAGRINYLKKYNKKVYANHRQQYVYSIILFTLFMENVSLFSQFYIILWFNRFQTLFKDTAQQVMYTRLEESIHAQVGIKLVNTLRQEYPELFDDSLTQKIKEEVQVAIKHESNLIDWIIGDYQAENISADILKNYIKIRLNDSLKAIGYDAEFEIDQALAEKAYWMDEDLLGEVKVDFFHKRPVAYQKHNRQYDVEDLF